jgi:hypothetical protein
MIDKTEQLVAAGELAPDEIHTPGGFVDQVVVLGRLSEDYGILEHCGLGRSDLGVILDDITFMRELFFSAFDNQLSF